MTRPIDVENLEINYAETMFMELTDYVSFSFKIWKVFKASTLLVIDA